MANRDQFEDFESFEGKKTQACAVCEAMLPEAVDGGLSAAEQRAFDIHVAGCVECSRELDEAQRGAAWLSMLKTQAPEPPAGLLAKILAETTGAAGYAVPVESVPGREILPAALETVPVWGGQRAVWGSQDAVWGSRDPVWGGRAAAPSFGARMAAFRAKLSEMFSMESARSTFQPRMAMTAAMAFFSIALTLNLTGVRLTDLRAEDFTASGLRRTVADAGASVARTFENNRVVYQVESRVSELRSDETPNVNRPGETSR